jgi:hypothetical protein
MLWGACLRVPRLGLGKAACVRPRPAIIILRYSRETSWREDNRRISNGDQVHMVSGLAMKRGPSVDFCGYWQRHAVGY